jgi:UDP-3-O-[3-hydroxymyristoyl] glucosamine N-acyltransferase
VITQDDLASATGLTNAPPFSVEYLDLAGNDLGRPILSFLDDRRFLRDAAGNQSLVAILVTPELEEEARQQLGESVGVIAVDDPRWTYFTLHNMIAMRNEAMLPPTVIAGSARIHPTAVVDEVGVAVGEGVVIEANATVLRSSRLHDGVVVRSGAIIGTIGFEHKRTSRGILTVEHDGETTIGSATEIGANAVVARGYRRRHTLIGADCRLDSGVFVAHGCHIGDRVFIAAGATMAGGVDIGDDAWIGPGATLIDRVRVGERARVGIGSVVFRNVAAGSQVLGNPARRFISS